MIEEHVTEERLERFLRTSEELTPEEREELSKHLTRCKLCEEHLQALQRFYLDLEKRLQEEPTERDRAFAQTLMLRKAPRLLPSPALLKKQMGSFLEKVKVAIEPYRPPLPQRLFRYVLAHPARTAGATTLAALALMAAFLVFRPPAADVNPAYAKIENYVLSVYSRTGEVLWTKSAVGVPDASSQSPVAPPIRRSILVTDIDGDASNEVLLTGTARTRTEWAPDTLYCFNQDSTLRWKHGMGSIIAFGKMDFISHSKWYIANFFTVENGGGAKPRLFVLAHVNPYFPSKLFELNPMNGREQQSYWHPGQLEQVLIHDIDLDGKNEIVLGGINNAYERACIAVLDPSHISGCGPTTPELAPKIVGKGTEEYYLLLPLTKLGETMGEVSYNEVNELKLDEDGSITVSTHEALNSDSPGGILYTIVQNMKVVVATGGDPFLKSHQRLVAEGKLQERLDPEYWEELKNAVRYWDGDKFVHEPIMNSLYQAAQNLP